jgi:hypothetical protein
MWVEAGNVCEEKNITITTGSCRENNRPLLSKERDKYTVCTIGRRPSEVEKGFYKYKF